METSILGLEEILETSNFLLRFSEWTRRMENAIPSRKLGFSIRERKRSRSLYGDTCRDPLPTQ